MCCPIKDHWWETCQHICEKYINETFWYYAKFLGGDKCKVAGWGDMNNFGNYPELLRMVSVPIKSIRICKKRYQELKNELWYVNADVNIEMNICAGRFGKDTCTISHIELK